MNPSIWLNRAAALTPDAPALMSGTEVVADYAAFDAQARGFATALSEKGLKPGDRVALFMTNCPDYLIAMYGVWMCGGAVVPVNAKLHPAELAWILQDSEAGFLVVTPDLAGDVAQHLSEGPTTFVVGDVPWRGALKASPFAQPVPMARDDLAWLFYTSGTTGRPKGVMISAGNILAMAQSYLSDVESVEARDAALYAAPMSHGAGLYNVMHVMKGARHVVPLSDGFDPNEILDLAPLLDRVHMFAAPTMVRRLVSQAKARGLTGEGIRTIIYGGGPMYRADIEEAVAVMGPRFAQIYGQGEAPMTITVLNRDEVSDRSAPGWQARLASVGRAFSGMELRIVDEAGHPVAPGEIGEITARGACVMPGYWRNAQATTATIRDGWLWTGDMGALDAQGYLTLHDRSKDMIISGGSNIYPREVEEALLTHPGIAEVAVIGQPDADWGEIVVGFAVPEPGAQVTPSELDAHLLERIARFKRPKAWHLVEALPKNNYGKVLKTELRARVAKSD